MGSEVESGSFKIIVVIGFLFTASYAVTSRGVAPFGYGCLKVE